MAKDTEKLIRQLSLISFLMAERRPVSALEIKQDVEGYSEMNDDAFARRFYADRAELEALGISLKVEKPPEGYFEAELYTLPPENFYLPPIEFSDGELAALQTSLALLDGRFAYAEPLRLALQQLSWGRPSPLGSAPSSARRRRRHRVGRRARAVAAAGQGRDRDLAPQDDRVLLLLDRARRGLASARSTPTTCSTRAGSSTSSGHAHEREDMRVFRLSRIREKISYATKAEHDFTTPEDFDPWAYAHRADWQLGDAGGHRRRSGSPSGSPGSSSATSAATARSSRSTQSGNQWRAGSRRVPGPGVVFTTEYAQPRQLVAWVLGPRRERAAAATRRSWSTRPRSAWPRSSSATPRAARLRRRAGGAGSAPRRRRRQRHQADDANGHDETPIRPERFARLVALAGILIQSAREGRAAAGQRGVRAAADRPSRSCATTSTC